MSRTDGMMGAATRIALGAVISLFVLNIADAFLTLAAVPEHAQEVNPVAARLLGAGPAAFLLIKILLVSAALAWSWKRIRDGVWNPCVAAIALTACAVVMSGVVAMLVAALLVPAA